MKIRFSEQFTVADLLNNAVSDITAKYLFDREHGDGDNVVKLFAVQIRNDQLYVHYRSYPTYTTDTTRVTTAGGEIRTEWYDTLFQFDKVAENLGDAETFKQFNPAEQVAVVADFLQKGLCRVWDNCGAYFFQGIWEDMGKIDSTIFPFPGPKGDGIWHQRHSRGLADPGIRICKHIAAAIPVMINRDPRMIAKEISRLDF